LCKTRVQKIVVNEINVYLSFQTMSCRHRHRHHPLPITVSFPYYHAGSPSASHIYSQIIQNNKRVSELGVGELWIIKRITTMLLIIV